MPRLQANGLRFHVQVLGDRGPGARIPPGRPQVVMIHDLVVDNLSSYYYTLANPIGMVADTHLYDLRGHGRSEVPATGYAVLDHVNDLRSLLRAWEIDRPVHLVGNSFGGVVALAFARLFPQHVASLVLLDPYLVAEGWREHMAGNVALAAFGRDEAGVSDWLTHYGRRKLDRVARHAERLIEGTSLVEDMELEGPFPFATLADVAAPTLAFYGDGSELLEGAGELERRLPDCELHVVPECAQSVLFEATPYVREQLLVWLDRLTETPA